MISGLPLPSTLAVGPLVAAPAPVGIAPAADLGQQFPWLPQAAPMGDEGTRCNLYLSHPLKVLCFYLSMFLCGCFICPLPCTTEAPPPAAAVPADVHVVFTRKPRPPNPTLGPLKSRKLVPYDGVLNFEIQSRHDATLQETSLTPRRAPTQDLPILIKEARSNVNAGHNPTLVIVVQTLQ